MALLQSRFKTPKMAPRNPLLKGLLQSVLLLAITFAFASARAASIFNSNEPLKFSLKAGFEELFRHRSEPPPADANAQAFNVPGELAIETSQGRIEKFEVKVFLRGNSSQNELECSFPKLKLKLNSKELKGTALESQKELNIGTHCGNSGGRSNWLGRDISGMSPYREHLAYQMLKELGIPAYQTRAAVANYIESSTGQRILSGMQALLLEDMGAFKKRMNAVEEIHAADEKGYRKVNIPNEPPQHLYVFTNVEESPAISMHAVAKIFLFEALVQNYDWKIRLSPSDEMTQSLWNVKMISTQDGKWIPVPYDFDLAAVVTAGSGGSVTSNVKDRLPEEARRKAYREFVQHRDSLNRMVDKTLPDDLQGRAQFHLRLDRFFQDFRD